MYMFPTTGHGTRRYRVGTTPSTSEPLASPVCRRAIAMSDRSRWMLSFGKGSWSVGGDGGAGGSWQPYLKSETSPQWSRPEPQHHFEFAEQGQESTTCSTMGGV